MAEYLDNTDSLLSKGTKHDNTIQPHNKRSDNKNNKMKCISNTLFRIMSIPTTFRLVRVLTSELIGRRLPVFTLLLWQRQHIIVVDTVDYK
jgi:hypothetical protein